MTDQEQTNQILTELTAGRITEDEARRQFAALGVDPDLAEEMIAIERGESDVQEV